MQGDAVTADRLLRALSNGEFEPYIQPVVRASDLQVSGGELLVRWHTSVGEIIPPACFIEQAESAGLLSLITQKILHQAVTALAGIKTMLPQGFRLAVNVTPLLLEDSDFSQMCLSLAGERGIRLVLELTEQQPFYITDKTAQVVNKLSDAGVEVALDDFGAGCSVLSYLKYFPVSYIKMDKSFIQDLLWEKTSRDIVECVTDLAERLGATTVAEGVETLAQANCLCALGLDYLQGYYFGIPVRLNAFISEHL
ncbi:MULTISPECIES: EAL domain-containing protein [unclassified Enterobacter]|uniref:EAL domain-containing protein n=1 Tax=unclassified Enterobacter TaxID=2608935 RepID=UPI000EF9FE0E|nr:MULTISPECIES: EAL domain-containing protein [unclassified Enterobacter]RMA79668.1 EAL domain-containing protein (putative c-di-GMP-specific phosphodiesterase class I) [Enterobacter sp. WP_7_1]RMA87502.1 EAL domain-containing protein (putative c-di-GMP-specific phosphodiesterase class I) [Enterobacter sp. WP_7_2]